MFRPGSPVGGLDSTPMPARYRCTACGNLTRFDVTTTRTTTAFHHYSVAGALEVEDERVVHERVESVVCRWCESSAAVVGLEADAEVSS